MRFAVVGAGSVGCYFGGMLARHGYPVVLIGRQAHVDAIRLNGLRMQTLDFDEHARVESSTDLRAAGAAEVVLVCVKSSDTASIAEQLSRLILRKNAVILSLQNGVENADTLRHALTNPVIASAVYVAAEMVGAGHLLHHGRGDLVIEDSAESRRISTLMSAADIPTLIADDVDSALWKKLILNCAYNAISAIVQLPLGRMPCRDALRQTMRAVVEECVDVGRSEGVNIEDDPDTFVSHIEATIPPDQYASTAHDIARSRQTEIEYLNGTIIRLGRANGVPTPANQTLYTLVKMLEEKVQHCWPSTTLASACSKKDPTSRS